MRKKYVRKRIAAIALMGAVLVGGSTATILSENVYAFDIDTQKEYMEDVSIGLENEMGIEGKRIDSGVDSEIEIKTEYEVVLGGSEHAQVVFVGGDEVSKEFHVGEKVELQMIPEESYTVRSITLMDAESGEALSDVEAENEDNLFSFTMPAAHVYVILNITQTDGNMTMIYHGAPGKVTTDAEGKNAGETVMVSVEPGDGCSMCWISVYDGETEVEICVEETEGGYTFVLPESGDIIIDVAFAYDTERLSTMTEFKYLEHSTACTYNAGNYVGNRFGITNAQVMNWLNSHRNDNYYLGTAYHISSKNGGSDNRQPNGDPGGESADGYGYDDYKGVASLNCTGFVWHALWRTCTQVWGCDYATAYKGIPAWGGIGVGNWTTFLRDGNYEHRTYFTKNGATDFWSVVAMLTDITNDGYLQPGDIIWTWDANTGSPSVGGYNADGYAINVGDGLSTASSDHHHTGIYIGNEQWWNSIRSSIYNEDITEAANQIGKISPIVECNAITVVKLSDSGSDEKNEETESGTATVNPKLTESVTYQTHVQNIGWQSWKKNGATSGTSGQSLRLEGICINLTDKSNSGGIRYQTHVQNIGWQDWKYDGALSGTSGQSLRLEAIRIELTGEMAELYDVYYRVHAQNVGWMGWAKNGASAGTAGYSYRLEAIQIVLVPKGGMAPGSTANSFIQKGVSYQVHVQNVGNQGYRSDGEVAGTSGQSLRLEGIWITLPCASGDSGIRYRTHVQNIGWQDWRYNGAMSGTSGQSLRLEAIRIELTGTMASQYDIYYRVHAQNVGWMGWAKNGASAGTAGYSYRLEAIQIVLVPKGGAAPGSTANSFIEK